jgi:hypothetical protein
VLQVDTGTVAVVLSALGVGGIFGGLLTAEQQRTERFRELMTDAAVEFVTAAERVTRLVDELMRERLEGRARDDESIAEAQRQTLELRNLVPRLSIVFPTLEGSGAHEPAHRVIASLRRGLALAKQDAVTQEDYDEAIRGISYSVGRFAGYANAEIWRRWFLRSRPGRRARQARRAVKTQVERLRRRAEQPLEQTTSVETDSSST